MMVQPLPKMQSNPLAAIQAFTQPRRNQLAGLAAGLLSSPNLAQGLSAGFAQGAQGRQADDLYAQTQRETADRQAKLEKTISYLRTQPGGSPWAEAAANGYDPQEAFKGWYDSTQKAAASNNLPSNVQEWEYFTKLTPEQQSQYLTMKRSTPYLDTGPSFVQPNPIAPNGTPNAVIPKDNFTPAYDAKAGAGQAAIDVETKSAADSLQSKMPGLQKVVSELNELGKIATYTWLGVGIDEATKQFGVKPGEAAIARTKYIAMVDNQVLPLLRDTFGAAFTVKEGETLRATLGDPNKSPDEKQAVLEAFIEQKVRDLEALQSRVPGNALGGGGIDDLLVKYGQ